MKTYRDIDTNEMLNEKLVLACCATVTVQDVMQHLDGELIHQFLADMRHKTLGHPSLHVSCEIACHVLKQAVYEAGANAAAKIQFGHNFIAEVTE